MLYTIIIVAWAWFMIGLILAMINDLETTNKLIRDHGTYVHVAQGSVTTIYYPHDDVRALQRRDLVFTTILGPLGIVLVGMDWLVRNWPESLVLGGTPPKPAPASPAEASREGVAAKTTTATNDVELEFYRQKAGIFNDR